MDSALSSRWLVLAISLPYSLFCLRLWTQGHAPSFHRLPWTAHHHYLIQALYLPFLVLACGSILQWVAGRGLAVSPRGLPAALALGILVGLVVPDWIVYESRGFSALGPLMRFTGPALLFCSWALCAYLFKQSTGSNALQAMTRTGLGLLAQAPLAALFIR